MAFIRGLKNMSRLKTPRPFLKWAGGKTQLVKQLLKRTPDSFKNYYEPFVGGGAFFFALYREGKISKATISDLNSELIKTYIAIRDQVEDVIKVLSDYPHDKKFFLDKRKELPENLDPPKLAARMIYLNKTCYNGLYRVNRQGQFNAPFGSYKNPKICDADNLRAVSEALQNVKIKQASFEDVLKLAKKNDLVYFDPPYEPLSKTANFTSYQPDGFKQKAQEELQKLCHKLSKKNVQFMLSNSSAELIKELYCDNGFFVDEVKAIRAINSNPKRRGKLTELIVTNYEWES